MRHMRRVRTIACVLVALTLLVTLLGGSAFAASTDNRRKIVMFNNSSYPLVLGAGITVLYNLSLINALAVELPALGTDAALALLQDLINKGIVQQVSDDVLTFVDPICPITALPPTSAENYRWGPQQIDVPAVDQQWSKIKGSAAVTVAVLDTGIASHSELNVRTAQGYNALAGTAKPDDGHGHGTHIAGIIAADKNQQAIIGVAGVESRIKVAAVKVLDDGGTGYLSGVIDGMRWVYDNDDILLVNMSFGFSFSNPSDGTPLMKAVQKLYEAGMIMVAAAGNRCAAAPITEDGGGDECGPAANCNNPLTTVTYPAAYGAWVIAVGATDILNQVTAYSLSGPQLAVVAPGGAPVSGAPDNGKILSTNKGGIYGRGHGTSQAAAHVTGAVALVLQLEPDLSLAQLKNLLNITSVDLGDKPDEQGAGRIDVKNMIEELLP
jgi:subtilisin family serine protease